MSYCAVETGAVRIYEYNRQWLTHNDSVNASM